MRELSAEQNKLMSIEILDDVVGFCDDNDIQYFLACGTLLGAAKYKGFIPWDDDIDIMMPRPQYERFLKTYTSNNYNLLKPDSGMYFYAKVYNPKTISKEVGIDYKKYNPIGISIDIFPLDGIPDDDVVMNKMINKSRFLETLLRLSNQPIFYRKNKLKAINRIIPRIIGSKNIVKMIENNAKKYEYDRSDYVIRYKDTPNGRTHRIEKKVFENYMLMFENKEYNVPKGYHEWLKSFYGEDYMEHTPNENERIIHKRGNYFID